MPPICYGQTVSGSASAGDGGFDINVGNHTQLDGGVIASTASADKNSLSTQTLDYANLHNESSYSGSSCERRSKSDTKRRRLCNKAWKLTSQGRAEPGAANP